MTENITTAGSGFGNSGRIADDAIRAELAKILDHPDFEATDRLKRFLSFVVEEALAGRSHLIKGRRIAREVFGRGEDFDATRDPIVRIEAGRLRRRLEHYYFVAGGHDAITIDIPKGRYVPRFKLQTGVDAEQRRGATELASPPLPEEGPTIAILPFRDLTADPEHTFFLSGLMEELVNEVNYYENVVAVAFQPTPAGADVSPPSGKIEARFVLGGSVRRGASELKIAAQLTDTETVRQVWGESYRVRLDAAGLIDTQEELARDVMAAIADEYGVIAKRMTRESRQKPPAELGTYEALLRYHHYMLMMSPEAGERALLALRHATEVEPDYGPTWAALANHHAHAYVFDLPGFDAPLETALEHALRGAMLAPESQLARTILAYVLLLRGDRDEFAAEAETALALNPHSPNFSGTVGYLLACSGDYERGSALLRKAIAQNPCHPSWFHHGLFIVHFQRGEYKQACREAQQAGSQLNFWNAALHAAALGKLGRTAEAAAAVRALQEAKSDFGTKVRELLPRTGTRPHLWEDLLDGLRKAGLRIEP